MLRLPLLFFYTLYFAKNGGFLLKKQVVKFIDKIAGSSDKK